MTQEEIKEHIQEMLPIAEKIVSEIELTNDKSRRLEWRKMKAYIKYAKEQLGL